MIPRGVTSTYALEEKTDARKRARKRAIVKTAVASKPAAMTQRERQIQAERVAAAKAAKLRALAIARELDPMLTLEEFEAVEQSARTKVMKGTYR